MAARLHQVPDQAPHVVGYVRVSMAREEMISPELQRQAIEDYCARRGYILVEIIKDLDATGRNFARAGIQRAIEMVEGAGVAVVVVWKYSRFGRDRKGWAVNLDRVERVGGRLESATEEIDTSTSTGRFSRGMLAEIAAWESDRIGEEWSRAQENRLANGLTHNGRPRYGYIYHRMTIQTVRGIRPCPHGCGLGECETGYRPDPKLKQFPAAMYSKYNKGDGYRAIAIWLNEHGSRTTGGKRWSDKAVRNYMYSGFAAGLLRTHPKTCRCRASHTCKNSVYQKGAHEPIIGERDWADYRRNSERRSKMPPRVENPVYPLAGFLHHSCDSTLTAVKGSDGTPGRRYRCTNYVRGLGCKGMSVEREVLEDRVLACLKLIAATELNEQSQQVVVRKAARATLEFDRQRMLREAQKLEVALARLTSGWAKGTVPDAAYAGACKDIEAEQAEIMKAIESLDVKADALREPPVEVARDLIKRWPLLSPAQKRELLSKIITRVTLRGPEDGTLVTTWGEVFPIWDT